MQKNKQNITIKVKSLVDKFNLELVNKTTLDKMDNPSVISAGLGLAGYPEYDNLEKVIIAWSSKESKFFDSLDKNLLKKRIKDIFDRKPALVLLGKNMDKKYHKLIIDLATEADIPCVITWMDMSQIHGTLGSYLLREFAPNYQIHGTLMRVSGYGVLIMGDSGRGKSEAALELLQKRHQLISDDAVLVCQIGNEIYGTSPEITRNLLEVRGLSILDVEKIYGYQAMIDEHVINLVVKLIPETENHDFDRLGDSNLKYTIYNIDIPLIEIPMRIGRNTSSLIEAAVNVQILRDQGFNTLDIIGERIKEKNDE
ncbi:Hpr(Ser) kinase/phosphatase [Mycoplasma testudineum]|uniref:Hpr(Ser) kinase/phosphatase n=1 Tax=Mycoplasma testudineum TaxID=244584 RepID=A0A4R6ICW2_9MOLU|nr:HPr(Ser) kinase/phosphatase [Mycoplasma testudineum]OYD26615.1 HPr(Ser) kinase/phosphatase [Mycoplasma testudineum]TDO19451.1 Hpr(Ser) kinase/phosphatase [Mycoplasma testudineum]